MLCDSCRWTERPGFIRRPAGSAASAKAVAGPVPQPGAAIDFVPCPDCGGQAIAHCCDGLREQPDAPGADG